MQQRGKHSFWCPCRIPGGVWLQTYPIVTEEVGRLTGWSKVGQSGNKADKNEVANGE